MCETESPNVQVVLNIPELLAQLEDDRALLGELLEIFKEECPPLLRSLAEAVSGKDARVVERTSHNLKGMLSTLSHRPHRNSSKWAEREKCLDVGGL